MGEIEEEWKAVRDCLVHNANEVCGKRFVRGGIRKDSKWWN